jgi:serine/threonine protein kinase
MKFASDIAHGMRYLHERQQMAHLDLKSPNVLLKGREVSPSAVQSPSLCTQRTVTVTVTHRTASSRQQHPPTHCTRKWETGDIC